MALLDEAMVAVLSDDLSPEWAAQGTTRALGAAAGEAALHEVTTEAGFSRFRRPAEAPFNLIIEARP